MEKSRQRVEARKGPRFDQDDADRLLIYYLQQKLQDPDGLHSDSGGLIPTLDVFSVNPDTFIPEYHMLLRKRLIKVMALERKDVWYFLSPMERPRRSHSSGRSVGEDFWKESSPQEDIVDEKGHKIGERRRRHFRNWAMLEYQLVDPQHAETSTAKKTMERNMSSNQDRSKWDKYVLCKIFKDTAAKKKEKDEQAAEARRIKEEASATDRGQVGQSKDESAAEVRAINDTASGTGRSQVGQSIPFLYIPLDDRIYWKDPAEEYDEQLVTEPPPTGTPAGAGASSKGNTIAASRPCESAGPYKPDPAAPGRRRGDFTAALTDLKEHHLLMELPFEPLPWLGPPPAKRKTTTIARLHTRGEAEDTRSGRNLQSQHDLVRQGSDCSSSNTAESSTSPAT